MLSIVIAALILLKAGTVSAQIQIQHQPPPFVETGETSTFEFRAPGINNDNIREAYFMYRYGGESAWRQEQASITDSRIHAEVTFGNFSAISAEYYLSIEFHDGSTLTWPNQNAQSDPASVEIIPARDSTAMPYDRLTGEIQHTVLTPEPGSRVRTDDFVLAIALFYEHEPAEPDSFVVQLNGEVITDDAEITPWLITYVPPEEPAPGLYTINLAYNSSDGNRINIADWDFRIVSSAALAGVPSTSTGFEQLPAGRLISSGQYQATARSQSYSDQTTNLLRNSLRVSGRQGNVSYSLNGLLTTQEDPRLQPQNRYAAQIRAGNWLMFEAGHVYPSLNPYLIAGRRMHGVHTELRLLSENLHMQFLYGKLNRNISPLYRQVEPEIRVVGQNSMGEDITDTTYVFQSQTRGTGTFARDIMGARVGFGSGRYFMFSVSALRVEDATQSIDVIRSYDDLDPAYLSDLDTEHRSRLEDYPERLDIRTSDPRPMGNFSFATDMQVNIDNSRVQLHSDFAGSLVNSDISKGILDKNRADELGFDLDDDVASLLEQLSWLIVINENMNALPLKIRDEEADIFVPNGIFATRTRLNLNYFNHNASLQYQWVGPDFYSLANVGQRRDIAGYTVSDRFRLLTNTLYLTLGHENLNDNVIGNRDATTRSITNRANLGWYPRSQLLPRVTIGVYRRTRDNGFIRTNPYLPDSLVNASVRSVEIQDEQLVVHPSPRNNETMQYSVSATQRFALFDLTHDASINYTRMSTDDHVFDFGDFSSNVFSMDLTSSFPAMPVRSNLGFILNRTKSNNGLNNLRIWGFNTGVTWYFMENRFRLNSELAVTFDRLESVPLVDRVFEEFPGPASDEIYGRYYTPDFESVSDEQTASYLLSGELRYNIHPLHALHLLVNYTRLSDRYNVLRIPDNHLVQMRYVFNF
ncbi:MAG: hypothetical protein WD097_10085 [Balneolales bacterium]